MKEKILSIVIPTFNSEKTLRKCLDSIVQQTWQNFDVWLIDGNSIDNTISIFKEYSTLYPFIYWTSEADKGIYDAMNKGIDLSKGNWLYFLGSDDFFFDPMVLERIFIENKSTIEKADFVYGQVIWGEAGKAYDGYFDISKLYFQNICHQAIFYRRDVFLKLGKFDLKYPVLADWQFNSLVFFDNEISKIYLNQIIAKFSHQGSSSIIEDRFFIDKNLLFYQNLKRLTLIERIKFKIRYCSRASYVGKAKLILFLIFYLVIYPFYFYKNREWYKF